MSPFCICDYCRPAPHEVLELCWLLGFLLKKKKKKTIKTQKHSVIFIITILTWVWSIFFFFYRFLRFLIHSLAKLGGVCDRFMMKQNHFNLWQKTERSYTRSRKAKDAGCPLAQGEVQSALWLFLQPFSGSATLSAGTWCYLPYYQISAGP